MKTEDEIQTEFQDSEGWDLNLDPSVLKDRTNIIKQNALMDRYGIHVFEKEEETQMKQYEYLQQQKMEFYSSMAFHNGISQENGELNHIREALFTVSYTPSREMENIDQTDAVWIHRVTGVLIAVTILVVGIWYGGYKKREREKKLADIDNRYAQ